MDPMGRFHEAVERASSRTDRSNDFLQRSREAVQRGVDRIERLHAESDNTDASTADENDHERSSLRGNDR
jgi:hypothetical protein